jgi:hypothetical protein
MRESFWKKKTRVRYPFLDRAIRLIYDESPDDSPDHALWLVSVCKGNQYIDEK